MAMQYDVLSAHVNVSSQAVVGRTRVKGIIVTAAASAGYLYLWDSTAAPVSVTYARNSAGVITVTHNSHGFSMGQMVGLVLGAGTGGQGTTGNYKILTVTTNTYTVQDINTGAITAGAAGLEASRWLTTIDTAAVTSGAQAFFTPIPGEGLLSYNGIYVTVSNLTGVTLFYG